MWNADGLRERQSRQFPPSTARGEAWRDNRGADYELSAYGGATSPGNVAGQAREYYYGAEDGFNLIRHDDQGGAVQDDGTFIQADHYYAPPVDPRSVSPVYQDNRRPGGNMESRYVPEPPDMIPLAESPGELRYSNYHPASAEPEHYERGGSSKYNGNFEGAAQFNPVADQPSWQHPEYFSPASQYVSAEAQHISPASQYVSPASQYVSPEAQHISPASQYFSPASQYVSAEAQHISPASQYISPASQHVSPAPQHFSPASQHLDPASQHVRAGSQHFSPASQHVSPASQHLDPASQHVRPGSQHFSPASQHVSLASQHVNPAPKHFSPASQYVSPAPVNQVPSGVHWDPGAGGYINGAADLSYGEDGDGAAGEVEAALRSLEDAVSDTGSDAAGRHQETLAAPRGSSQQEWVGRASHFLNPATWLQWLGGAGSGGDEAPRRYGTGRRCWARVCWHGAETTRGHSHPLSTPRYRRYLLTGDQDEYSLQPSDGFRRNWKVPISQRWQNLKSSVDIFRGTLKDIEGQHGTAIVSYFLFLKWLILYINLPMFIILFCFVIIPNVILSDILIDPTLAINTSSVACEAEHLRNEFDPIFRNCSRRYVDYLASVERSVGEEVADFLQGTNRFEYSYLFYGRYDTYESVLDAQSKLYYKLPMAYWFVTFVLYFCISVLLVLRRGAIGWRENIYNDIGDRLNKISSTVFTSWDFCISKREEALRKSAAIYLELKVSLSEFERKNKIVERSTCQSVLLYTRRALVAVIGVAILVGAYFLIDFMVTVTPELAQSVDGSSSELRELVIQYLTSITITALNIVVPVVFSLLAVVEAYSPQTELKLALIRTVFLRLYSVALLVYALFSLISNCKDELEQCELSTSSSTIDYSVTNTTCPMCWETYVGQQMYKLVWLDFFATLLGFLVFVVRSLIYKKSRIEFIRPEFDIQQNVLDLVYLQTLSWLGTLFSPILPFMTILKCIVLFLGKKAILKLWESKKTVFRASRSNSFFVFVLLLGYTLCIITVGIFIQRFPPSKSCGPFRRYETIYGILSWLVCESPERFQTFLDYVFIAPVALIVAFFLAIAILVKFFVYKLRIKSIKAKIDFMTSSKRSLRQSQRHGGNTPAAVAGGAPGGGARTQPRPLHGATNLRN